MYGFSIVFRMRYFIYFFIVLLGEALLLSELWAQPINIQKRSNANSYSRAGSVFTRTKDRYFSNYDYQQELKNREVHFNAFSGFSTSIGTTNLFGLNYGLGVDFDYYLKEAIALRTGLHIRNNQLFSSESAIIARSQPLETFGNLDRKHYVRVTQLLVPVEFLFTTYKRNYGFWIALGLDLSFNIAGVYEITHRNLVLEKPIPANFSLEPDRKWPFFESNIAYGSSYFNRFSLYGALSLGFKISRFANVYARTRLSVLPLHNAFYVNQHSREYINTFSNHSIDIGFMMSLWQY